jgi:multidrug resistance efflux pump
VVNYLDSTIDVRRSRRSRSGRVLKRTAPFLVWLLAVGFAIKFREPRGSIGRLVGYGEATAVALTQLEPGVVRRIHVQLHAHVEQGQLLVEMDDRLERMRLETLRLEVERARAEVSAQQAHEMMDDSRATVQAHNLERQLLLDRELAHVEHLSALVSDATNRAELRGATIEYEIVRDLYQEGHETYRELNLAETKIASLTATIEQNSELVARQRQRMVDAEDRYHELNQRHEQPPDFDAVLTPLRLAVDERESEVRELMQRLELQLLRAPVAGLITAVYSSPGERVPVGGILLQISPTQTQRVVAYIPEDRALAIQGGERVVVERRSRVLDGPREFEGTVTSLSSVVSEAPVRYRMVPNIPTWGRAMLVTLDPGSSMLPGEPTIINLVRSP